MAEMNVVRSSTSCSSSDHFHGDHSAHAQGSRYVGAAAESNQKQDQELENKTVVVQVLTNAR